MDSKEEIKKELEAALSIINITLKDKPIPFRIIGIEDRGNKPIHAIIDIDGKRFLVARTNTTKLWISNFPIDNSSEKGLPAGYIGFPSDIAGAIEKYYKEKPKGIFQNLDGIGKISLNEIVKEEIEKVFGDYETFEAQISSTLSFMQDSHSSINKLRNQKELMITGREVDKHLEEAISQINMAVKMYFKNIPTEVRDEAMNRVGEVNIEK